MPCTSSNCWSHSFRIIWEEERDLQPFIMGLFTAMYYAGASRHCCSMSKDGLIKKLRTWSWSKSSIGLETLSINKTQPNKQNLSLLWALAVFYLHLSKIPRSWICYTRCFLLTAKPRRLCFQLDDHGCEGSRGLRLSTHSPLWFVL